MTPTQIRRIWLYNPIFHLVGSSKYDVVAGRFEPISLKFPKKICGLKKNHYLCAACKSV